LSTAAGQQATGAVTDVQLDKERNGGAEGTHFPTQQHTKRH